MPKIFAVFVNYNFGKNLAKAVGKVLAFPSIAGAIIVDNASKDESVAIAKQLKSKKPLKFILNRKNKGFDVAVNSGIKLALKLGADYIIPLDTDLDFSHDFVTRLYNTGGDYVVPVLKFKRSGKWVYDYGGRVNWVFGRTTHLETSRPLDPGKAAVSTSDQTTKNWVDFVSGGCTLTKREVFEKIGFYDEKFFLYFGDTEFALRARQAGFKVVVDPTTFMWHAITEHKVSINKFKISVTLQGNLTFINKWIAWYFKPLAYGYFIALVFKVLYNVYLQPYAQGFRNHHQL